MDPDGFLYVLGRFKSLLISNDGEKFSPEGIEEAMVNQSPFLEQVMLYNNQNPYTVGLVVPAMNAIDHELEKRGIRKDAPGSEEAVLRLIQEEVDAYKREGRFEGMFPDRWLPAAVALLPEAFTEANGLINSTTKMVRGKITKYFKKELDYVYKPEAKNIVNPMNLEAVRKWNKS
jgi:long-chain acyl-CoA synthetase